jgi:hypothetical protein
MNASLLAGLLFLYIFLIQYVPMGASARLAAQLSIGLAGTLLAFYIAKLSAVRSLLLFTPVAALYTILVLTGLDGEFAYFASFGLLVVAVLAAAWYMRRA